MEYCPLKSESSFFLTNMSTLKIDSDSMYRIDQMITKAQSIMFPEFEVHFGSCVFSRTEKQSFHSFVQEEEFYSMLKKFQELGGHKNLGCDVTKWEPSIDVIFASGVRMRKNPNTGCGEFMKKQTIMKEDIRIKNSPLDIRFILKTETPCHYRQNDEVVMVRARERIEIKIKNYSYCFTKVWSSRNFLELYKSKVRFEIEIEIINPKDASSSYLVQSLIMKAQDMLSFVYKDHMTNESCALQDHHYNTSKRKLEHVQSRNGKKPKSFIFQQTS